MCGEEHGPFQRQATYSEVVRTDGGTITSVWVLVLMSGDMLTLRLTSLGGGGMGAYKRDRSSQPISFVNPLDDKCVALVWS